MNAATQFAPSMFNTRSKKNNYYTPINVAIYGRVSTEHDEQFLNCSELIIWGCARFLGPEYIAFISNKRIASAIRL